MDLKGKLVVAQGGGPTAVINQSMVGVALEARKYPQITKVYGALNGINGIVNQNFVDLSQETTENLELVAATPSSGLGSTRDKPDAKYCEHIFQVFRAHDVRYFFYIGGNDSSDTVRIVNEYAKNNNYDFRAIHIPKTIDNDLMCNDHTPGFPSAARFVAQAFMGINLDNRALPGVHISVIMGRHAGFLAAASAAARLYPDDGPHLIYTPECPFSIDKFIIDVKSVYDRLGRCVVSVSEGIQDKNGTPVLASMMNLATDAHGNVQLSGTGALGELLANKVKEKLSIGRVRSDTFGYLQRSFMGCVSDVDQREAREVGEKGVQFAMNGATEGSVTINRIGNYAVDYRLNPIEDIAAKTKLMPDEFINAESNYVTPAFMDYLRPLLGSGMPEAARLRAPRTEKLN